MAAGCLGLACYAAVHLQVSQSARFSSLCTSHFFPVAQEEQTLIDMNEPVALTFALRYLINFTKATSLSPSVVRRAVLLLCIGTLAG